MLLVLAGSFVVFELSGPPPHWVQRRTLFEDGLRLQADLAYETLEVDGTLPLLTPMSEVAGRMAVQVGAHFLEKYAGGRGVLLGGVPGVAPARVVVLGCGLVGGFMVGKNRGAAEAEGGGRPEAMG